MVIHLGSPSKIPSPYLIFGVKGFFKDWIVCSPLDLTLVVQEVREAHQNGQCLM